MKKSIKIFFCILILLAICWGIIFLTDYIRCSKIEMPIFVIAGETADDGGSGIYYGLGYRVEVKKRISAEYGVQIGRLEMYFLDKCIAGGIVEFVDEQSENINNTENNHSFIGTVLEETTRYMIVQPNEDEEERKSSDKIVINYGTDHKDYLYGIGRKVLINYTGYIMETYPAQINTDSISVSGYSDFEISVKASDNKQKVKILNNTDLYRDNSDYNLYYYGLDEVNITVDNKTVSLEEALRRGKVTLDGIIAKANNDLENNRISGDMYKDGGSMMYNYEQYTIIKFHTLSGNRDICIGIPEMMISDI